MRFQEVFPFSFFFSNVQKKKFVLCSIKIRNATRVSNKRGPNAPESGPISACNRPPVETRAHSRDRCAAHSTQSTCLHQTTQHTCRHNSASVHRTSARAASSHTAHTLTAPRPLAHPSHLVGVDRCLRLIMLSLTKVVSRPTRATHHTYTARQSLTASRHNHV